MSFIPYPILCSCLSVVIVTESISEKFPWYGRMHALMGTSPLIVRSGLANSTSPLDLTVLSTDKTSHVCELLAVCYGNVTNIEYSIMILTMIRLPKRNSSIHHLLCRPRLFAHRPLSHQRNHWQIFPRIPIALTPSPNSRLQLCRSASHFKKQLPMWLKVNAVSKSKWQR